MYFGFTANSSTATYSQHKDSNFNQVFPRYLRTVNIGRNARTVPA